MSPPNVRLGSALLILTLAACSDASDGLLAHRSNRPGLSGVTARVFGVGASGLAVRAEPTTASAQVGTIAERDRVTIECLIEGEKVEGNDVWARIEPQGGYVSDAFLDGPPGFAKGAPHCESPSSPSPDKPAPPSSPSPTPTPSPDGGSSPEGGGGAVHVDVEGPAVQPHVQVFADAVCAAEGECRASTYVGHSPSADLALDLPTSAAYGQLPTEYVICRQRINLGGGWQAMEDRGNITQNHFDHVHVSFKP